MEENNCALGSGGLPGDGDDRLDDLLTFGNPATRRTFLKQMAGTSAALAFGPRLVGAASPVGSAVPAKASPAVGGLDVRLKINGKEEA